MIEVLKPGPLAVVEDAGRFGLAAVGVGRSGAFDRGAYARGAGLVGNPPGLAAIEVTLGGLVVRSAGHHLVALTGAECPATVAGASIAWGEPFLLRPADVLTLGLPPSGLRSYLSVAGGFDVPPVLGSRSTDLLSGLGPARLTAGDFLPVGSATGWSSLSRPATAAEELGQQRTPPLTVPAESGSVATGRPEGAALTLPKGPQPSPSGWSSLSRPLTLELLAGPRTDWLADPGALAGSWTVSPDSNRIGVRLTGHVLNRTASREGEELPSEPLVRGAVQLPPSGQPVVFGPDHPTTGGYPVVAVLTEAANDLLGQCRPGDTVQLRWATGGGPFDRLRAAPS